MACGILRIFFYVILKRKMFSTRNLHIASIRLLAYVSTFVKCTSFFFLLNIVQIHRTTFSINKCKSAAFSHSELLCTNNLNRTSAKYYLTIIFVSNLRRKFVLPINACQTVNLSISVFYHQG